MSYWLEDADGDYLGDLASNAGLKNLREKGPTALREFLEQGEADDALVQRVVSSTVDTPSLSYIAGMLRGALPPVSVTDGSGEEYTDNAFCPTGKGGGVDPSCSPSVGSYKGRDIKAGTFFMSEEETDAEARRVAPKLKKVGLAWKKAIKQIDPGAKVNIRCMGDRLSKIQEPLNRAWVEVSGETSEGKPFGMSVTLWPQADGNTIKMGDSDLPKSLTKKGIFSAGIKAIDKPEFNLSGKFSVHHSSNDKAWQRIADKFGFNWKDWQESVK